MKIKFPGNSPSNQSVELTTNEFCLFVCFLREPIAEEGLRPQIGLM